MKNLPGKTQFSTSEEPQRASEVNTALRGPSEAPLREKTADFSGVLQKPQTSEASEAFFASPKLKFSLNGKDVDVFNGFTLPLTDLAEVLAELRRIGLAGRLEWSNKAQPPVLHISTEMGRAPDASQGAPADTTRRNQS